MSNSITLMVPLKGDEQYYDVYSKQFWRMLSKSTYGSPYNFSLYILINGGEYEDSLINKLIKDCKTNIPSLNFIYNERKDKKGPCRGTLLNDSVKLFNSDYYLNLDFDDILDENYFKLFQPDENSDLIIGKAARYLNGEIIPKEYLNWRPKEYDSKLTFLTSGRYGIPVWGRFIRNDLAKRIINKYKDMDRFDLYGWGDDLNLGHALFSESQKFGYCDSLYLFNYGVDYLVSESKKINKENSIRNIELSLQYLPDQIRDICFKGYLKVLDLAIKDAKVIL